MKHAFFILTIPALLLSSCTIFVPPTKTLELKNKEVSVYDLAGFTPSSSTIYEKKHYYAQDTKLYFIEGKEDIPYVDLTTYAELLKPKFAKGNTYKVEDNGSEATLYVYNADNEALFIASVESRYNSISYAGSPYAIVDHPVDISTSSLSVGLATRGEYVVKGRNYISLPLSSEYPAGAFEKHVYLPLSYLDIAIGGEAERLFYYSGSSLYIYDSSTTLQADFLEGDEVSSPIIETKENHPDGLSLEARKFDRDVLLSTMETLYGLKTLKSKGSMKDLYASRGTYDNLLSDDPKTRAMALVDALGPALDDDHTGIYNINRGYGEAIPDDFAIRGTNSINRRAVQQQLKESRGKHFQDSGLALDDVEYSADKRTAIVRFDSFAFSKDCLDFGGNLQEKAYYEDTFFALVRKFKAIKENGITKNVVLDISLNGGGVVGVLMKILALLSKDNRASFYRHNHCMNNVTVTNIRVDSNLDTYYDEKDCYGNDFNFYFLTSPASFSCGNALPYLAQKLGFAKCIGVASGGGECTVATGALASGHVFSYSSPDHMGFYSESKGFEGDENGCAIDTVLDYDDFYNVDKIVEAIA